MVVRIEPHTRRGILDRLELELMRAKSIDVDEKLFIRVDGVSAIDYGVSKLLSHYEPYLKHLKKLHKYDGDLRDLMKTLIVESIIADAFEKFENMLSYAGLDVNNVDKALNTVRNYLYGRAKMDIGPLARAYRKGYIPKSSLRTFRVALYLLGEAYGLPVLTILNILLSKKEATIDELLQYATREQLYIVLGILKLIMRDKMIGYKYPGVTNIAPPFFNDLIGVVCIVR